MLDPLQRRELADGVAAQLPGARIARPAVAHARATRVELAPLVDAGAGGGKHGRQVARGFFPVSVVI